METNPQPEDLAITSNFFEPDLYSFQEIITEHEFPRRQLAVAFLAHLGFSNREVAEALVITPGTVKNLLHNFRDKYSVINPDMDFRPPRPAGSKQLARLWKPHVREFCPSQELLKRIKPVFYPEILHYLASLNDIDAERLLTIITQW